MKRPWLALPLALWLLGPTPGLAKGDEAQARGSVQRAEKPAPAASAARGPTQSKGAPKLAKQVTTKRPCYARPVQLVRVRGVVVEPRELSLTFCNGQPNPAALDSVSVLARPRDVERPSLAEIRAYRQRPVPKGKVSPKSRAKYRDPLFLSERVLRVHPGLLLRLQKIANRYPGKIIEIISGYRPDSRDTSRHHHGRALDLRVAGIPRERLRDYLRTFDQTGVGYYPNSYFVHMDVRDTKGYWVDRSGPGEPADYGPWPPPRNDVDSTREGVLRRALADLGALGKPISGQARTTPPPAARASGGEAPVRKPEHEPDDMTEREVSDVRAEARRALEEL